MRLNKEGRRAVIGIAAMLLGWGIGVVRARAYEHITGKHVSAWDAMFLDLRVQEPVKGGESK